MRQRLTIMLVVLGIFLGAGGVIYTVTDIAHADSHSCTADITVYEDGSWGGLALHYDGEVLDKRWDEQMPTWGFPPQVGQTMCDVHLVRSKDNRDKGVTKTNPDGSTVTTYKDGTKVENPPPAVQIQECLDSYADSAHERNICLSHVIQTTGGTG